MFFWAQHDCCTYEFIAALTACTGSEPDKARQNPSMGQGGNHEVASLAKDN